MMVGYSSFNVSSWLVLSLQSFHAVSFNSGSRYVVKKGTSMVVPQPTAVDLLGKPQICSYCGASSPQIQSDGYSIHTMFTLPETNSKSP